MKSKKALIQNFLVSLLILNVLSPTEGSYNSNCSYGFYGVNCNECGITNQQQNLIVGGITATAHSWPSIAYVKFDYALDIQTIFGPIKYSISSACGGTLIDRSTILTAAHCILTQFQIRDYYNNVYKYDIVPNKYYPTYSSMFTVYLGLQDKSTIGISNISPAVKMSVAIVKRHANFLVTNQSIYNDIALLILSSEVTLNEYIQIACLPESKTDSFPTNGPSAYAVGWGTTSSGGSTPSLLRNVKITVYDNSQCPSSYLLQSNQICAGELAGGKDTCQGDSGGPLYVQATVNSQSKFVLAGITSFGDGCGKVNTPGAYTRVSSYLDWINSNSNSGLNNALDNNSQVINLNNYLIFICFIIFFILKF